MSGAPEPRVEMPAMSDYGVAAETWNPLPWEWARERLVRNKNFWVITVSGSGRPHSLPVWGAWDPDSNRFGFSCSPNAAKARHLGANPAMAVTVDDTVECVSVEGTARPMPDEVVDRMVGLYVDKYVEGGDAEARAGMDAFVRSHALFEFTPIVAYGIIEREEDFSTRPTRWRF